MRSNGLQKFLLAVFALACAAALVAVWRPGPRTAGTSGPPQPKRALGVLWRVPMPAAPNTPCAFDGGWIVSDNKGGVTALSMEGRILWRTSFSNHVFECGAAAMGNQAFLASEDGRVTALRDDTGEVMWARETEACFRQAPLTGSVAGVSAIWLVSQSDGQLFCLRAADGTVVWKSEPTNRCDGAPVMWRESLAYGNCDGAVYVFDAATGAARGSVKVGDDDQMAGGLLATADGRFVAGTRQGNLAVVNVATLTREALVNVSQGEAFATPAEAFGGLIAMGAQEGDVTFWRRDGAQLQPAGRVPVGKAVDLLLSCGESLFVLAGGSLFRFDAADRLADRLPVGDDVRGLAAGRAGRLACVADGAVVCVIGGNP